MTALTGRRRVPLAPRLGHLRVLEVVIGAGVELAAREDPSNLLDALVKCEVEADRPLREASIGR
jgi:hypothetical protein